MEAILILSEIAKTNTIYGHAAKQYLDNEKMAKEFILELHSEIQNNRIFFINNYGTNIIEALENFIKLQNKDQFKL